MDLQLAIQICEQLVMAEDEEEIEAWQYLIDTGVAWKLQGWYARTAKRLIDEGVCDRFIPSADPYRAAYYREDEIVS
jgi:hypothetical protein